MLVAFYSGSGECRDDQSVSILFIKNGTLAYQKKLEGKTGNPVLWQESEDRAVLLYSKFEDNEHIVRLVDRWKFCSLWTVEITRTKRGFDIGQPQKLDTRPHLLGRCLPIKIGEETLLPLYDEINRCGVIYSVEGTQFKHRGDLGKDMIQPTLWEENGALFAIMRNFGNRQKLAFMCVSKNKGETWSQPFMTDIPNNNSSLHACKFNKQHLLLWNNTLNRYRYNMTLGQIASIDNVPVALPISKVGDYGAYPTILANNDRLCFSFTNSHHEIEYYEWNAKKIEQARAATAAEFRRDIVGQS
jgi:hypothetical protein